MNIVLIVSNLQSHRTAGVFNAAAVTAVDSSGKAYDATVSYSNNNAVVTIQP